MGGGQGFLRRGVMRERVTSYKRKDQSGGELFLQRITFRVLFSNYYFAKRVGLNTVTGSILYLL